MHSHKASYSLMHTMQSCSGEYDNGQKATTLIKSEDIERLQREIEAAERHHQRIAQGMVHLPDGRMQATEEMDLLHEIPHIEKTIKRIASTKGPVIKRVPSPINSYRCEYVLTPLGEAIWMMCHTAVPLITRLYPDCRKPACYRQAKDVPEGVCPAFNPSITVALHACQIALPILNRCAGILPDVSQKAVRDAIEHLVCSVRRICCSRRFKYLANNYERNAHENFKAACKYMAKLFAENARLLILRVDIYVLPDHKEWADTEAAEQCIERFLRALRESRLVPDVKGWLIRCENGFRRGIHLHVLVAMDGHKHRQAASWSKVLGEAWVNKYSAGKGSYFNCYTRKDWYRFNGLGLVHVADQAKLMGVREALRYMTKADFHIATGFVKNFRKGWMPSSKEAKKRGAPRKAEHGMTLVNRILSDTQVRVVG